MNTKAKYPRTRNELATKNWENMRERADNFKQALQHIEEAIQLLADAPQMDFCGDQQHFIEELEAIAYGDNGEGGMNIFTEMRL